MPEGSPQPFLALRAVRFAYGPCPVVDGVSAVFPAGRLTAILGPNGAGKSTLMRMISGEMRPSGGSISLGGRPIGEWQARELARQRAMLPQFTALSFQFTVEEVVLLGRAPHLHGGERDEDLAVCRSALETVDMLPMAARDYTTLSGGEQQRVQLARVLAQVWERQGKLLLLDEPVAAMDLAHQHTTLALAREWAASGACVLAVLHDLNLALRYADDVLLLRHGRVAAHGPSRTTLTAERVREVFSVDAQIVEGGDCPFVVCRPLAR